MKPVLLVNQVIQKVRSEGGRMTAQRRLILEALESHSGHPTAEEVYASVRRANPDINLSTVYRTLRWLEENGFVAPRWFEDDRRRRERFDPVSGSRPASEHFHFRCRMCNRISEFDEPLLGKVCAAFEQRSGSQVESATLVLYGVCARCQSS